MKYENLAFLGFENSLNQYIEGIDIPAYAKVLLVERILNKQRENYQKEIDIENNQYVADQELLKSKGTKEIEEVEAEDEEPGKD